MDDIGASADLGSNSVHLLVASISGHRLEPLLDESVFLGLGAAIDTRGYLGSVARGELVRTLQTFASSARGLGAKMLAVLGTEPIRRAADAARIVRDVEVGVGFPVHVLSHEEEAYLTLVGVTGGWPVTHETLVVDIGGGSSEFCAVRAGESARAAGLRLGSDRLTNRFATTDPAGPADLEAMGLVADDALRAAMPASPTEIVVVGGTASNLLKVTAAGLADPLIDRARLSEAFATLGSQPSATVSERYGVNPRRARLLPAGAIILDAVMRRYEVDRVRVSEAGLREGAILAGDHAGVAWRDRLPRLAHGWRA